MKQCIAILLLFLAIVFLQGCYTCSQFMDMQYDECMKTRNDKTYCAQRASAEAYTYGACGTSTYIYHYSY